MVFRNVEMLDREFVLSFTDDVPGVDIDRRLKLGREAHPDGLLIRAEATITLQPNLGQEIHVSENLILQANQSGIAVDRRCNQILIKFKSINVNRDLTNAPDRLFQERRNVDHGVVLQFLNAFHRESIS
jgi:hypothetical protein